MKKIFRVIKCTEAKMIGGEWVEQFRVQWRYPYFIGFGRWTDVTKPEVYTTDSPISNTSYTEVRHVPAFFKNAGDAVAYCTKMFNRVPQDRTEQWEIVKVFDL